MCLKCVYIYKAGVDVVPRVVCICHQDHSGFVIYKRGCFMKKCQQQCNAYEKHTCSFTNTLKVSCSKTCSNGLKKNIHEVNIFCFFQNQNSACGLRGSDQTVMSSLLHNLYALIVHTSDWPSQNEIGDIYLVIIDN